MADSILGLITSAKFAAENDRFYNHRRKILYSYPAGNCSLTGILSLADDEPTDDTVNIWYEQRYQSPQFASRGTNPLTLSAPSTCDADDGTVAVTATINNVTTDVWLKVDSTKDLRPSQVIQQDTAEYQLWVIQVVPGVATASLKGYVKCRMLRAVTPYTGTDYTAGTTFSVVGTAVGEGASDTGLTPLGMKRPYAVQNQCQIFRTAFTFTGTVLKEGLKYDASGPYKKRAKEAIIEHMTSIERTIIWGKKSTTTRAALTSGDEDEVVRTMSGILEFIRLWDAGSTGLQIDGSTYAPYGFKTASTLDSQDQKRIIDNTDGTISVKKFNIWAERVTRYSSGKTRDKLILCGSGCSLVFAELLRKNTQVLASEKTKIYGLSLTTISTPCGDFHLMNHPLFSERADLRQAALILDVWNIKFRPLRDRDTTLRKMIQPNGADRRKDEYLTEATLEFVRPDSCMYIKNISTYVES